MNADVIVIGAGTVGAAIAYGLVRRGLRVVALDGDDGDYRAARANFGLVWLQGKGMDMPAYQTLTRNSIALWPDFCAELSSRTASDLEYENHGGLVFCFGEQDFETRKTHLQRLHNQWGGQQPDWEMLDRGELEKRMPGVRLGPEVSGASFGRSDGHANPLKLLSSLHRAQLQEGGTLLTHSPVQVIRPDGAGFVVETATQTLKAQRIVIAAGLGSRALALQLGLDIPLRPQRGQLLVTEKLAPFLPLPASGLRQTASGTVMIGATQEETGFDLSTTTDAATTLSRKAIRCVPALADVALVRQWSGLRVMTPDSYPVYAQSPAHPGAFVALCHSGVTLAALHAGPFAQAVCDGQLPASFDVFHHRRFDVSQAA